MKFSAALFLFSLILSCSSEHVLIQPNLAGETKKIGKVRGNACGFLGILSPEYYFIPIRQNSKVERAYAEAMNQIPGTKAVVNLTIQETWYWVLLGVTQCLTITGDAVQ